MKKKEGKKMVCPNNASKDFDDLDCRDCQWYFQCFKMWQSGNIWNKDEPMGDNFPSFIINGICKKDTYTICNLGYACDGCPYNAKNKSENKTNKITQEEINQFKKDLDDIIFFSELEKKLKE
jgi:uncharacterized CHY-type Zn-finger protein